MRSWGQKNAEWKETVTRSLAMSAAEADKFMELERSKQIALDCARSVWAPPEGGSRASALASAGGTDRNSAVPETAVQ
jgi:hypothetical protein